MAQKQSPLRSRRRTIGTVRLGSALDAQSMAWLNDNLPDVAEALEVEVANGATPDQVRRFVMARTQRVELALRCEQAARAIAEEGA